MFDRDSMIAVWTVSSVLWLGFAFINAALSIGDLRSLYKDHPTSDEKIIAWQRWRHNAFRLYLAFIFTLIGWLSDNDPDENRRVRTTIEQIMVLAFLITPVIGAIFEGWQFTDRARMRKAYARIGRRQRSGRDTVAGNNPPVYHRSNDGD